MYQLKNEYLISNSEEGHFKIWCLPLFQCVYDIKEHLNTVRFFITLTDKQLVTCSYDMTIKRWDLNFLSLSEE